MEYKWILLSFPSNQKRKKKKEKRNSISVAHNTLQPHKLGKKRRKKERKKWKKNAEEKTITRCHATCNDKKPKCKTYLLRSQDTLSISLIIISFSSSNWSSSPPATHTTISSHTTERTWKGRAILKSKTKTWLKSIIYIVELLNWIKKFCTEIQIPLPGERSWSSANSFSRFFANMILISRGLLGLATKTCKWNAKIKFKFKLGMKQLENYNIPDIRPQWF